MVGQDDKASSRTVLGVTLVAALVIVMVIALVTRGDGKSRRGDAPTPAATTSMLNHSTGPDSTEASADVEIPRADATAIPTSTFAKADELWGDLLNVWWPQLSPDEPPYLSDAFDPMVNDEDAVLYWSLRPWLDYHREAYGPGTTYRSANQAEVERTLLRFANTASVNVRGESIADYRARVRQESPHLDVSTLWGPTDVARDRRGETTVSHIYSDAIQFIYDTDTELVYSIWVDTENSWDSQAYGRSFVIWLVRLQQVGPNFEPVQARLVELDGRWVYGSAPYVPATAE